MGGYSILSFKIVCIRKTNVHLFQQYPDISDGYNYNYDEKETLVTPKARLKTTKR